MFNRLSLMRSILISASVCAVLLLFAVFAVRSSPASQEGTGESFDVLILHGHIIDGTGSPWYAGDVGIRDGRVAAIGSLSGASAKKTIDAHGMVVAPGFIDMLGQSELTILVDPRAPSKIYQGITTEITGEGDTVAPQTDATLAENAAEYKHYGIMPNWRTFTQYFARLRKQGIGINLGTYVGATQVRRVVIGTVDRDPTPAELARMKMLVDQAMQEGALGLSTALEYPPAPYAKTDELIALAAESAKYGGIYATHMRSESDAIMDALAEVARIAREGHTAAEIFHLKAGGFHNWGRTPQIIKFIDDARASGLDITADTYAYTAWNNDLASFIPPWAHDGGDAKLLARLKDPADRARIRKDMLTRATSWDNPWQEVEGPQGILISTVLNPKLISLEGKRISEIAEQGSTAIGLAPHSDPIDTIFAILLADNANTQISVFGMKESDVELVLKQPWVSVDNDYQATSPWGILGQDHPHPRAYGTFPRILRKYVREQHLLTLPDAIRKFTALPAQREHLIDRGVLKKGMWADVVVFDPATIHDVATYANPNQFSVGMKYVLVNGVPVIDNGKMTGARPGHVLLGPGYRAGS
ncbi:MAG TPA: D-aminoacylase [Candidatus Acidoferrum sp.]|nr:D-aminoacylase [Candidatus Acidoferrum sp.]